MDDAFGNNQPHPQQPFLPQMGQTFKLYCAADPDFFLAVGDRGVIMKVADESDAYQQWFMDNIWNAKVKDDEGFPAFALVNKATGQALRHGRAEKDKVILGPYHFDDLNEAVLFTQSADLGKGYHYIRPVHNTHLTLDASAGDKQHLAILDGTEIVLRKMKKKESQKWKISPILGASAGVHLPRGEQSSFYSPQATVTPEGHTVKIHSVANPDFLLVARGNVDLVNTSGVRNMGQGHLEAAGSAVTIDSEANPRFDLASFGNVGITNSSFVLV